jgi:CubicO group peptidase (beta-lactamase class C family)
MTVLSDKGVDALRAAARAAQDEAGLVACQYALALDGEIIVTETLGSAPTDARFVIMSSTKPLLASVVWQLIAEGELDPALPVATWWPEFARNGKEVVTLEHVMVHTAGLTNATLTEDSWADRSRHAAQMEAWTLEWEPGTKYEYHGLSGHWILAELIERRTGADFRTVLRERVLDPLGLDRLELGVPEERQGDVQPLGVVGSFPTREEIEELIGAPLTAMAPSANMPSGVPDLLSVVARPDLLAAGIPGANAVSDAASLALFYQHLLHDPKGLWDPAVLHDAKTNVRNRLPDTLGRAAYRTLGFETAGDDGDERRRIGAGATSPGTFGHGGAGGQVAWADPVTGLSFVFLTSSIDINIVRQYRRDMHLTTLAARCAAA